MPARRGGFSASLTPFGGGTLNLDDAYRVEALAPSQGAPTPHAPPPLQYGGAMGSPWDQEIPIVGQSPIPESVLSSPVSLPSWSPTPIAPVSQTTINSLDRYITNLTASGSDPAKLATYTDRREEYLSRGTPTPDYSTQIASLDRYITNLSAVTNPTPEQLAKLATYEARRDEYAGR